MENRLILSERKGKVCLLTINRPEQTNRLNIETMDELRQALGEAEADPDCGAVVLTGAGSHFCNGGELGDYRLQTSVEIRRFGKAFIQLHMAVCNLKKPVIAAVQGDAAGGGFNLVEACDLAVAAEDAKFSVPEIAAGIAPMMALTGLSRIQSRKGVMEAAMLGNPVSAKKACEMGLVNWVCPKDEVAGKALAVATEIAGRNPVAVALLKKLYGEIAAREYESQLENGLSLLVELLKSEDAAEAIQAREEERMPVWRGL